jgi:hypothetical protein
MKKTGLLCLIAVLLMAVLVTSCASYNTAGKLPDRWWTMSVGDVQKYFQRTGSGEYRNTVLFIGKSNSILNVNETIALEQARLDASLQLSRYLSQKVAGLIQTSSYVSQIQKAVDDGKLFTADAEELISKIKEAFSSYSAAVTNTRFSSLYEHAKHLEKSGRNYTAYVCYSMSEEILEETRKLQNAALAGITGESDQYKEVLLRIQEIMAQELEQSILSGVDN